MSTIAKVALIGVVIYAVYVVATMFLWDACWSNSRTALSPPINWVLVSWGVVSQGSHLLLLYLVCRWINNQDMPSILNIFNSRKAEDPSLTNNKSWVLILLLVTVFSSRFVGWGFTQGNEPVASFIGDKCWDWAIISRLSWEH